MKKVFTIILLIGILIIASAGSCYNGYGHSWTTYQMVLDFDHRKMVKLGIRSQFYIYKGVK